VFGVLYSVYALYASLVSEQEPIPAPICRTIRYLCRILAGLMILSVLAIAMSTYRVMLPNCLNLVELAALALPIIGMLGIALFMAFFAME